MTAAENLSPTSSRQSHWDAVYRRLTPEGVSWYEPEASLSLALIEGLNLPRDVPIIDIGGGASPLVDGLLAAGYSDVSVLDLSGAALQAARDRLRADSPVHWLNTDVLSWKPDRKYALWHDRALYHFLTHPADKNRYLDVLANTVADAGYVVLATFASDGPETCSGLPVARYGIQDLKGALEPRFEVLDSGRQMHRTPSDRLQPFSWVVAGSGGQGQP